MKTWDSFADAMLALEQDFRLRYRGEDVAGIHRHEALAEWLDEKDREHDAALTAAIRQFAQTGRWPELTKEQCLLIYVRVQNALLLLRALASSANGHLLTYPNEHIPASIHLVWLLDTAWRIYRHVGLLHAARELTNQSS